MKLEEFYWELGDFQAGFWVGSHQGFLSGVIYTQDPNMATMWVKQQSTYRITGVAT